MNAIITLAITVSRGLSYQARAVIKFLYFRTLITFLFTANV